MINNNKPLVCDLDETLVKTDTLYDGIAYAMTTSPLQTLKIFSRFLKGRLYIKNRLVPYTLKAIQNLQFNDNVLNYLQKANECGRNIYLATASPRDIAVFVAEMIRDKVEFSKIYTSTESINLKGYEKARVLSREFPEGFDYIGNSKDDFPVWRVCNKAIIASKKANIIQKTKQLNNNNEIIQVSRPNIFDYFNLLRINQWVKNLLVFIPFLLVHNLSSIMPSVFAFLSFCFCASSIYILNDVCDVQSDRTHPIKKNRPFASGAISLKKAPLLFFTCTITAFIFCIFLHINFTFVIIIYLLTSILYSLKLKKYMLIDVVILSMFYVLRIIAGAVAIQAPLSSWFIGFFMFFFLGLSFLKRVGELVVRNTDKLPGREYEFKDKQILNQMAVSSGFASLIVLCLYIDSMQALKIYKHASCLWCILPLLTYWFGRIVLLINRGTAGDDPIRFTVKDNTSYVICVSCLVAFMCAI